ncbi:MAG: OB-fold nucleic acid binding domain-containing protein [Candidatus Nanopelagicales bacterium]|jgi:RecG-like helicase
MNFVGRTLRRLTESTDQRLLRESAEEHERRHPGEVVAPITSCTPGEHVTVSGTIASLEVRPEGSAPALEVELRDESGHVFVVWLGRRRIPGLLVGRNLVIHGRLNCVAEHPTIYNPRYELLPG